MSTHVKPHVIILGPGGVKGFLQLGLLYILTQNNFLDDVHTYIGVSIGSIISLLVVCNYSIDEIISHAIHTDLFEKLNLYNITSFNDVKNFLMILLKINSRYY
jgi:predicted acylesterase/phospholipase RssA